MNTIPMLNGRSLPLTYGKEIERLNDVARAMAGSRNRRKRGAATVRKRLGKTRRCPYA